MNISSLAALCIPAFLLAVIDTGEFRPASPAGNLQKVIDDFGEHTVEIPGHEYEYICRKDSGAIFYVKTSKVGRYVEAWALIIPPPGGQQPATPEKDAP